MIRRYKEFNFIKAVGDAIKHHEDSNRRLEMEEMGVFDSDEGSRILIHCGIRDIPSVRITSVYGAVSILHNFTPEEALEIGRDIVRRAQTCAGEGK